MKKLIWGIVIAIVLLLIINGTTDIFSDIGEYLPALEEKCPSFVQSVEEAADYTAEFTDKIPTPSEIMAMIKNEPLPLDPSDTAVNAYIADSPMLTFYPHENISAKIKDGAYLRLFGVNTDENRRHFVVMFTDTNGNEAAQISMSADSGGEFDKTIKIPDTDARILKADIYTGSRAYGNFTSWVYNYLYIIKDENGLWSIHRSPVYQHNKTLYCKDRPISEALRDTPAIETDEDEIAELAQRITQGCGGDYEKLAAIHDWVCENIWYDVDGVNSGERVPYSATQVLANKSAVCLGFSTLTAALCRSAQIPCSVVSGYALGVGSDTEWSTETINTEEQNHAWNEAYVDGRWIILDTTWDCPNRIENGVKNEGKISHIYFDANIDFFSANHKIIEYMKRP